MNVLKDAQLPRRMAVCLSAEGCDAVHTLDLPDANRTTDEQIIDAADQEGRAVITKDADFVDSHILRGRPAKLLLISTGNISNWDLEAFSEFPRSSCPISTEIFLDELEFSGENVAVFMIIRTWREITRTTCPSNSCWVTHARLVQTV